MAEIITPIEKKDFVKGVFIELECSICGDHLTLAAETEEDLSELIKDNEWNMLKSDEFGQIGQYCGCEYLDEAP